MDERDLQIIDYCSNNMLSITDIQKELKISYISTHKRIKKLKDGGFIRIVTDIHTQGAKKIIIPDYKNIKIELLEKIEKIEKFLNKVI